MKTNEKLGLKTIVALRGADFVKFYTHLETFATAIGFSEKGGDKLRDFEITASDFVDAGFSADEAAALLFVLASEGANDLTAIDNWFARNKGAVACL